MQIFFYLCDKVLIPKLFSRSTNISDLRREYRVLNFLKYDKKNSFSIVAIFFYPQLCSWYFETFDRRANFPFTTSEMKRDY